MNIHPILFSSPMVQAILDGRKTQTRRVVKGSPDGKVPFTDELPCPYGLTGDTLWVRETWQAQTQGGQWWHEVKRDDRPLLNWAWTNPVQPAYEAMPPRWLPGIHMPKVACRIELKITRLRIEKLHCISNSDAKSEGVEFQFREYRNSFMELWDEINFKRGYGWNTNPLVWVVEFEAVNS